MIGRQKVLGCNANGAWSDGKRALAGIRTGIGWKKGGLSGGQKAEETEGSRKEERERKRRGRERGEGGFLWEERRILVREKEAFGKERGNLQ